MNKCDLSYVIDNAECFSAKIVYTQSLCSARDSFPTPVRSVGYIVSKVRPNEARAFCGDDELAVRAAELASLCMQEQ